MVPFNWVKERSLCSLECVFQIFGEVVDSDVKSSNALNREGVKFEIKTPAHNKLMVIRSHAVGHSAEMAGITFELLGDRISVQKRKRGSTEEIPLFSFAPSLNLDGECLVRVDGESEMLKLWQVSMKALEDLFFAF